MRLDVAPGYESLASVLDEALAQAQGGKGKERHACGEPYHEQQIVQLCEWMGSNQGDVFQACKKALESTRLPHDRARAELLGAINYLAAAVIVLDRKSSSVTSRGPSISHSQTLEIIGGGTAIIGGPLFRAAPPHTCAFEGALGGPLRCACGAELEGAK